ncbi:hypothetical protein B0H16DRAFT_1837402 [Mycena metata]|uniref:Uncharacterized protein n=1 Tax=Mycena metata TaxID=1033252 RepID=A0AAD7IXB2_9AGAR|nr:hypothetical protein B0H16DRAFT_1837402 [Mycena metata]
MAGSIPRLTRVATVSVRTPRPPIDRRIYDAETMPSTYRSRSRTTSTSPCCHTHPRPAPQTHGGDHLPTASISRGRYSVNPRRAALPGVHRTRFRTTSVPPPPPPFHSMTPHTAGGRRPTPVSHRARHVRQYVLQSSGSAPRRARLHPSKIYRANPDLHLQASTFNNHQNVATHLTLSTGSPFPFVRGANAAGTASTSRYAPPARCVNSTRHPRPCAQRKCGTQERKETTPRPRATKPISGGGERRTQRFLIAAAAPPIKRKVAFPAGRGRGVRVVVSIRESVAIRVCKHHPGLQTTRYISIMILG